MGGFGIVEFAILLVAVAGSGAMMAFMTWVFMRLKGLPTGAGPDVALLTEELRQLRDEMSLMRDDMGRLIEQVDFTERLLGGSNPSSPENAAPDDAPAEPEGLR